MKKNDESPLIEVVNGFSARFSSRLLRKLEELKDTDRLFPRVDPKDSTKVLGKMRWLEAVAEEERASSGHGKFSQRMTPVAAVIIKHLGNQMGVEVTIKGLYAQPSTISNLIDVSREFLEAVN